MTSRELHLVLMAGSGRSTPCESQCREPTSRYRRCGVCRRVFRRCEVHARTLDIELAACCSAAKSRPPAPRDG